MAAVNPPSMTPPTKLMDDPELSNYFRELSMFLYQLWQRTGGGVDGIEEDNLQIEKNRLDILEVAKGWPDITYSTDDFQGAFVESVQSKNYTTYTNEIIKLSNDINVTLNTTPLDKERVYVKSTGKGFNVKSTKKIDGHKDIRFNRPYSGYWFSYSLELDTWSIL